MTDETAAVLLRVAQATAKDGDKQTEQAARAALAAAGYDPYTGRYGYGV